MECRNQSDSNPYYNYIFKIKLKKIIIFLEKETENIGFEPMMGIAHN